MQSRFHSQLAILVLATFSPCVAQADTLSDAIAGALERAGQNRLQIQAALDKSPKDEQHGMRFLVAYMPPQDLQSLSADFLLENVGYAYRAWNKSPWKQQIPEEVFLNYVLPYASIHERRDNWRKDFCERFQPLVEGIESPGKAGASLNQKIFPLLKVRYSTKRPKAFQSPYESIEAGMASCSGLSVLLVDACRAVGIPARFVGIADWGGETGNHSWVEIWDAGGWHFTGVAEPAGDRLDVAWFSGRAAGARSDEPANAIFAARWEPSPVRFPRLSRHRDSDIFAVNVTNRYKTAGRKPTASETVVRFQVLDKPNGVRVSSALRLTDAVGNVLLRGPTRDESFDLNDHLEAIVPTDGKLHVEIRSKDRMLSVDVTVKQSEELFTFLMTDATPMVFTRWSLAPTDQAFVESETGQKLAAALRDYFAANPEKRTEGFLDPTWDGLVLEHSAAVRSLAWDAYCHGHEASTLQADFDANRVTYRGHVSPYVMRAVGSMPKTGWPLFIAMHGGGGTPAQVNDSQWRMMQHYYRDQPDVEGYLYLAIRAPNDASNGFYHWYNLGLSDSLIRQLLVHASVDSNKVYAMGYSHGGYGAFYIGPQMADRFAAVHASASAPSAGKAVGKNLRNTVFTYMIGENDTDHSRIRLCREFETYMNTVRGDRKDTYPVTMEFKAGIGHGGLPDRDKIKDMYAFTRNPLPRDVTWYTTQEQVKYFNWLYTPRPSEGKEVNASCRDNRLTIGETKLDEVHVLLDERLVDYRKPLEVSGFGQKSTQTLAPSLRTLCESLAERGDPEYMFASRLVLKPEPTSPVQK